MIPTFIGHCPGSPCAVCGRIDLPGGATAQPDTRPLCGAHFATWERQRAEIETDRAARDRPPVRDIREAMHPASAGDVLSAFAPPPIDIGESGRAAVQGVVDGIGQGA